MFICARHKWIGSRTLRHRRKRQKLSLCYYAFDLFSSFNGCLSRLEKWISYCSMICSLHIVFQFRIKSHIQSMHTKIIKSRLYIIDSRIKFDALFNSDDCGSWICLNLKCVILKFVMVPDNQKTAKWLSKACQRWQRLRHGLIRKYVCRMIIRAKEKFKKVYFWKLQSHFNSWKIDVISVKVKILAPVCCRNSAGHWSIIIFYAVASSYSHSTGYHESSKSKYTAPITDYHMVHTAFPYLAAHSIKNITAGSNGIVASENTAKSFHISNCRKHSSSLTTLSSPVNYTICHYSPTVMNHSWAQMSPTRSLF